MLIRVTCRLLVYFEVGYFMFMLYRHLQTQSVCQQGRLF
jgi:hypothetical protein